MTEDMNEPQVLEEPGLEDETEQENVWMRGLWMLVLAILFGLGETLLAVLAVIQFLWMLFTKVKNRPIADFGTDLADWLARVAKFQTGTSDDKPFPFAKWGPEQNL